MTEPGTVLGTFQYVAPEQLQGERADTRTDLFAFGLVLYEMLTGTKAFQGGSRASRLYLLCGLERLFRRRRATRGGARRQVAFLHCAPTES